MEQLESCFGPSMHHHVFPLPAFDLYVTRALTALHLYSHEELMEQLESTNRDLFLTSERLRSVEAQRMAAVKDSEAHQLSIQRLETECRALQAALKQR